MPLSDYTHWNEEAPRIWWEEEGKHYDEDAERCREDAMAAEDAFAEDLAELDDEQLLELRDDQAYLDRWPKAAKLIDWEIKERGIGS